MRARSGRLARCAVAAIGLALFGAARSARAIEAADLLVLQSTAERHGLTRAWFTQIPSSGQAHVTYVVQDDGMLFVQTNSAMLYAIDAETGRIVWSTQTGESNRPTLRPAANGRAVAEASDDASIEKLLEKTDTSDRALSQRHDKVVAVVNGTTLYLLNRADGSIYMDPKNNIAWKVALRGMPEAGPLVTEDMVYVPTSGGPIEVYLVSDSRRTASMMSSSGHTIQPPIQAGDRIAWATDKGVLQITQPKTLTIRHRIQTTGAITAMLTSYPPQVYAASIDGFLYAIDENSGEIVWKLTTGSAVRETPAVIRGALFTAPEDGGMFRAAATDGRQAWFNPTARHFLSASPTKIYALDAFGKMVILNAKTGATIDSFPMPEAVLPVVNGQTDRIILSSDSGLLQSLHEPALTEPRSYVLPKPEAPADDAALKAKAKAAEEPVNPKATPKQPAAADDSAPKKEKPTPAPKVAPKAVPPAKQPAGTP